MDITIGSDIDAFVREHVQYLRLVDSNDALSGLNSDLNKLFGKGMPVYHFLKRDGDWEKDELELFCYDRFLMPIPTEGVSTDKTRSNFYKEGGICLRFWREDLSGQDDITQMCAPKIFDGIGVGSSPRVLIHPDFGLYFQQLSNNI